MPPPASSIYSRSARSPSPPTSPRYESTADDASNIVEAVIESYRFREGVPSTVNGVECHKLESDVHEGSSQANGPNQDALMLLSPGTRSTSPASIRAEAPNYSLRTVEGNSRRERLEVVKDTDRVGQAHDALHEIRKEGYRTNPHRIEKPQYYKEKKRLKQQK